jgi:hypothetical protein
MGNSTNTGRLSVAIAIRTPSAANEATRSDCRPRTATQIAATNTNVVQTSVITSAPKYGIGGNNAVAAAAASASDSPAIRLVIANTSRQIATNRAVCASATGSWPVPATL